MATFKFYSYNENDASPHYTTLFSNFGDLKDQLYYFGVHLTYLFEERLNVSIRLLHL